MSDPKQTVDFQSTDANDIEATQCSSSEFQAASEEHWTGELEVPGYRIVREIARGGMGRVLHAEELELARDVAIKLLLPGAPAERFVREARIAAQLTHPCIPPVYAFGILANRSPFLAMKLVVGKTLTDELAEKKADALAIFEQVCQAIGFAHSKGIVHRDLKPANIMVGEFGEVQVMDWGLAKNLNDRDWQEPKSALGKELAVSNHASCQTKSGVHDFTLMGSILGTPAYMSPEQARGEEASPESDVFALGAILCHILTGVPPFHGESVIAIIRHAASAQLAQAFANLDQCGADEELVLLCKRCLSAHPPSRPANGKEVAESIAAFRSRVEERMRAAERERAVAKTREAESQKRRRTQLALAATTVLLLLGAAGVVAMQREQARAASDRFIRNAIVIESMLAQARETLSEGDAARAATILETTRKQAQEGHSDKQSDEIAQIEKDIEVLRRLNAIEQMRWTPLSDSIPSLDLVGAQLESALRELRILDRQTLDSQASYLSQSPIRSYLIAALDQVNLMKPSADARALLRKVDPDPYRDSIRNALMARNWQELIPIVQQDAIREQSSAFIAMLGVAAPIPVQTRRELLKSAIAADPSDFELLITLATTFPLNQEADRQQALRWYQGAASAAPNSAVAFCNLGSALKVQGDWEGALAAFERAAALDPTYLNPQIGMGLVLKRLGQLETACQVYRQALKQAPGNVNLLCGLASACITYGDWETAKISLEEVMSREPENAYAKSTYPLVSRRIQQLQRFDEIADGKARPTSAREGCDFARIAAQPVRRKYALATRLIEQALVDEPALKQDIEGGFRYDAACYSARAAADSGSDTGNLSMERRAERRDFALSLLCEERDSLRKLHAESDPKSKALAKARLDQMLVDVDLASTRPGAGRAHWAANQIEAWDKFWAETRAMQPEF